MSAFSDYLENALINHVFRNTALTSPTSVWLAVFTASTGLESNSPSAEVSGGSYARLEIIGSTGRSFVAPSGGATSNNEEWQMVEATANWGTVTHFAIMDALTTGNALVWGALTASKIVNTSDVLRFKAGELDISLD